MVLFPKSGKPFYETFRIIHAFYDIITLILPHQKMLALVKLNGGILMEHSLSQSLQYFRQDHPEKSLQQGDYIWRYYTAGESGSAILLLPGGMGMGEAYFSVIQALKTDFQLIAPSYPEVVTIKDMMKGLLAIVDKEGHDHVHVLGVSFGGLLAQEWIQRYPNRVNKVILSNTTTSSCYIPLEIKKQRQKKMQRMNTLIRFIPNQLLLKLFQKKITPHFKAMQEEDKKFWTDYFFSGLARKSVNQMVSMYKCMLDFLSNYSYTQPDQAQWEGRIMIIDSISDGAFHDKEQMAVRELYPFATVISFPDAGHLSIITAFDSYLLHIKKFFSP